jgi:hypothetical protein
MEIPRNTQNRVCDGGLQRDEDPAPQHDNETLVHGKQFGRRGAAKHRQGKRATVRRGVPVIEQTWEKHNTNEMLSTGLSAIIVGKACMTMVVDSA